MHAWAGLGLRWGARAPTGRNHPFFFLFFSDAQDVSSRDMEASHSKAYRLLAPIKPMVVPIEIDERLPQDVLFSIAILSTMLFQELFPYLLKVTLKFRGLD